MLYFFFFLKIQVGEGQRGAFEPKFCLWDSQNYNLLVKSICSLDVGQNILINFCNLLYLVFLCNFRYFRFS